VRVYHSEMLRAERQQHMAKDRVGQSGKRLAPFSLRLTFEERAKIESRAGNMPIGAYIKSVLLTEDAPSTARARKGLCRIKWLWPVFWPSWASLGLPII
jgi:hypothetical protein